MQLTNASSFETQRRQSRCRSGRGEVHAQRRILLAEVHPDDKACGGTIARHALSSDKLQVILLTNGVGAMDEKDIPGASRCRRISH